MLAVLLLVQALGAAPSTPIDTPHLTLSLTASAGAAAPGGKVLLYLDIAPKAKMHVYAPQQKDYIPVAITLEPGPAFRVLPPVFPKPEKYFFAPLKETQLVYSKPFRIVQEIALATPSALREAGIAPGTTVTISGKVRYQACDDAICYLPKDLPVSWRITVKAP
jgi:hypothetical protein